MQLTDLWSAGLFVHAALICYVLGFLIRDEVGLRVLIIIGSVFYILYYMYAPNTPLWDAIFASAVICLVNVGMVTVILRERSTIGMDRETLALYDAFSTLNPGQFRRIMRLAEWHTADQPLTLTRQGEAPIHLYYLFQGTPTLIRDGREVEVAGRKFIGEVSFLLEGPASATIRVPPGARYVAWDRSALFSLMERRPGISNALRALFNMDLARKLANSSPDP